MLSPSDRHRPAHPMLVNLLDSVRSVMIVSDIRDVRHMMLV